MQPRGVLALCLQWSKQSGRHDHAHLPMGHTAHAIKVLMPLRWTYAQYEGAVKAFSRKGKKIHSHSLSTNAEAVSGTVWQSSDHAQSHACANN